MTVTEGTTEQRKAQAQAHAHKLPSPKDFAYKLIATSLKLNPTYEDAKGKVHTRKGIHSRDFNAAFSKVYGVTHEQAIAIGQKLVETKVLASRPTRGGFMLYHPDNAPAASQSAPIDTVLKSMGF